MRLYLLKHKGCKTRPDTLADLITRPVSGNILGVEGVKAFLLLRDAKKHLAELKKKYKIDYEIVKFESIERRRR